MLFGSGLAAACWTWLLSTSTDTDELKYLSFNVLRVYVAKQFDDVANITNKTYVLCFLFVFFLVGMSRVGLGGTTMRAMKERILRAVGDFVEIDDEVPVEVNNNTNILALFWFGVGRVHLCILFYSFLLIRHTNARMFYCFLLHPASLHCTLYIPKT